MPKCAYCGQPLETWNDKHTHEDCMTYLKDHPEGGALYEKMGGRHAASDFFRISEVKPQ